MQKINLYLLAIVSFFSLGSKGQDLRLDDVNKSYIAGPYLQILIDKEKKLDFDDIKSGRYDDQFEASDKEVPNYAYMDANFWFKLVLNDQSAEGTRWYLESSRTQIDTISVFFKNYDGSFTHLTSGDLIPYKERIVKHKNFVFPIPQHKDSLQEIYIQCKGNFSKQFPFTIIEERSFAEKSHTDDITMGLLFGIFLAMVVYNLFLFLGLRSMTYLYYVLYMGSFLLAMMALTGYGFEMLFHPIPRFANVSNMFFIALTVLFASQFTRRFLDVKRLSRIFHYALFVPEAVALFLITISLIGIWNDNYVLMASKFAAYCGIVGVLFFMPTGIWIYRKGSRPAFFYLISWTALFLGVIIYVLKNYDIFPQNTFTDLSIIIGAVFEAILLSLGMADRIKILQLEQRKAQQQMIEALQENERLIKTQNQVLEEKVEERTKEIMEKNVEIEQQLEEIAAQRDMLTATKHELERQNDNVTASINYAKRIQKAMLPQEERIKNVFRESFILFKPRDIVSGDFYWYTEIEDKRIFTVADCTGHGVPGAFMSMIGINLLHEIVNVRGVTDPAHILFKLNEGVQKSLKQDSSNSKDGMDMSLVVIDPKKKELTFSGAKNHLVVVENDQLRMLKGSTHPIGGLDNKGRIREYSSEKVKFTKDSMFYMFSDGYQDQFGGPEDKKFMIKRLKELLETIADMPAEKQHYILEDTIDKWMAKTKQLDDILMVGFRI